MVVPLSACASSTRTASGNDTPAGLQSAATSWAHAFLTGTAADISSLESAECRSSTNLDSSTVAAYLKAERAGMARYFGEPLSSIKVTSVEVRNFAPSSGEAEVQYDLPAAKVGNDNWVTYEYQGGRWKVSDCHAPIGGESSSSGSSSASVTAP
jgi:hypothetical protein